MKLELQRLVNFPCLEENKKYNEKYYESCFFKSYKDYLKKEIELLDQKIKDKKLLFMFKHYLKQIKHIIYNNKASIIELELSEDLGDLILTIKKQDNKNYKIIVSTQNGRIIYQLFIEDNCFYISTLFKGNKHFLEIFLLFITQDEFPTKETKSHLTSSPQLLNRLNMFEHELFERLQEIKKEFTNNLKLNNFLELENNLFHNPILDLYIYISDIEIDNYCYVVYNYSFDSKENTYYRLINQRTNIYDFFDKLNNLYNEHKCLSANNINNKTV